MRLPSFIISGTVVILLLSIASSVPGEIAVEPIGFALGIEEDAEAEVELVLANSGEDDVAFVIDYELIVEEEWT